jgi:hypothetical protein
VSFLTKIDWASFWAIFLQTHPVTLIGIPTEDFMSDIGWSVAPFFAKMTQLLTFF